MCLGRESVPEPVPVSVPTSDPSDWVLNELAPDSGALADRSEYAIRAADNEQRALVEMDNGNGQYPLARVVFGRNGIGWDWQGISRHPT